MNIKGVGIGRGVAVGPVIRMAAPLPEPSDAPRAENISAETEIARVEKSLALVNADLNRRAEEAANGDEGAKQAAPILQAIAMFASDPSLAQSIKDLINQGKTAERAVLEGFGAVEDMFRAIGGYQAERAADLHDVGQRVIADLMGAPAPGLPVSETPFVLVAEDLSPADTAALDMSKTLAIVTSQGGPTSHTAILARARGIVAVVSAAEAAELENGTNVIVNAAKGEIVVNPSEDEIAAAEAAKSRAAAAKELRGKPGATKDGHLIPLLANVGKPSDAAKALEYGAEGVGLFRTEFLFIGNSEPPSVEEQTKAHRAAQPVPGQEGRDPHARRRRRQAAAVPDSGRRAESGPRPAWPAYPARPHGRARRPAQGARRRRRRNRREPVGHGPDGRRPA